MSHRFSQVALLAGASLLALSSTALAQTQLSPVVVTAPLGQSQDEMAEATTVLQGAELERRRAATLGETLDGTPGVSSTQFGPGAGRPVIRGQSGPRVRVLENGVDTFDASTVSPDHAVVAPVGGAQKIEVLRGPATLLYGSSAIGGVVNVIDGRIPEAAPKNGTAGQARLDYGTGAQEMSGFAAIDQAVTDGFVVHGEVGALNADDYAIDGYASQAAREAGRKGRVDNSAMRNRNGAVGASYLGEAGYAGMSLSRFNSYYGVPGADPVRIDMRQSRLDTKFGLYEPLRLLEEVKLKVGYADYLHDELEPSGARATRFDSESWEARLEATHKPLFTGSEGVVGAQSSRRDLTATGEEAFISPTVTDSHALFLLEKYQAGPWGFSLGGRAERVEVEASTLNQTKDFTPLGISAGATYKFNETYMAGLSLSRTERAPSAEELFSNGAHVATRSFEIGSASLNKETALHAELSLRKTAGDVTGAITGFATRFQDYIFGAFTGNEVDGLTELQYSQVDADFRGGEIEAAWTFFRGTGYTLAVDGSADYVRGEARNGGNLPRIPPVGYRSGFTVTTAPLDWRLEVAGRLDQENTGANESRTDGYTLLNTAFTWRPFGAARNVALQLQGRNLTDEEGRNHTSLLKDVAPIRGREVRLGLATAF